MEIGSKIVYNISIMARTRKQKNQEKKAPFGIGKQIAVGLFVLCSVLAFSVLYLLEAASQPIEKEREIVQKVAKDYAKLTDISEIKRYNGQESYYSVKGTNAALEQIYVLVPTASSEIYLLKESEGIAKDEAIYTAKENGATEIDQVLLGIWEKKAIWEVKSGSRYFIVDFETGELLDRRG